MEIILTLFHFMTMKDENITYMCTKVSMEGTGQAITSSCFKEYNNATGREIQVCVCESRAGQYPCNSANSIMPTSIILFSSLVIYYIAIFIGRIIK